MATSLVSTARKIRSSFRSTPAAASLFWTYSVFSPYSTTVLYIFCIDSIWCRALRIISAAGRRVSELILPLHRSNIIHSSSFSSPPTPSLLPSFAHPVSLRLFSFTRNSFVSFRIVVFLHRFLIIMSSDWGSWLYSSGTRSSLDDPNRSDVHSGEDETVEPDQGNGMSIFSLLSVYHNCDHY